MNKNHETSTGFTNIGSSSLLVVFLVLCLTVFALLSLSGAKNDLNFSMQMAQRKTSYYSACSRVEEALALIDEILNSSDDPLNDCILDDPSSVAFRADGNRLICLEPIDEKQGLSVVLELDLTSAVKSYRITTWKVVNLNEWEAKDNLQLVPVEDL